jgi:hypothetical protein
MSGPEQEQPAVIAHAEAAGAGAGATGPGDVPPPLVNDDVESEPTDGMD